MILLYTGSVLAWYSLQDIWKWRNEEHGGELQIEGLHGKETFKTESVRKLSNFTFQWTKTLYQNNFKHTGSFFTLFEGYKCHKLYEITPKKCSYGSGRKQTSKASIFTKWNLTHYKFYLCFISSCEVEIYFLWLP